MYNESGGYDVIELKQEDCQHGIVTLYDRIAQKLGFDIDNKRIEFNCRKICVSIDIQTELFKYYRFLDFSDFEIGAIWLNYGPKANIHEDGYIAHVFPGFIKK